MDIAELIRQRAQERGVNPDVALSIAQTESSLRPGAKNPRSTARGLFQVTDGTWKQYGGDPKKRGDVNEDIRVGLDIIADNTQALTQTLGREPTLSEVYAAHFFGKAGARKILSADPNTPVSEVVSRSVMRANPEILKGRTVGEAVNELGRRVGDETPSIATGPESVGRGANRARSVPAVVRPVERGYREDPANPPIISQAVEATRDLGPGYQAALALSYLSDTEESSDDENDPSIVEREAAAEMQQPRSSAAQQLAQMDFGYAPVVGQQQQEPVQMFMGGLVSRVASATRATPQEPAPNFTAEEIAQIRRGLAAQGFKEPPAPPPSFSGSSGSPIARMLAQAITRTAAQRGPNPNQLSAAELQALYGTTGLEPQMVERAPARTSTPSTSSPLSGMGSILARVLRGTPTATQQVPQYGLTQDLIEAKRAQLRGTPTELGFGEVMPEAWDAYKARFPTLATFTPGQVAPVAAPTPIEVPTPSYGMPNAPLNIPQPGTAAAMMQDVLVPTGSIMDMQVPVRMATGGLLDRAASVVPFSPTARRQYDDARSAWEAYQQQVDAYNAALEQWQEKYYNPYMSQIEAYNTAVEKWNAGPRTTDFGMAVPTLGQEFTNEVPTQPGALSPEEMDALVERAQRQRSQQAQALQVAADPSQFGLSMPSLFADGGEVTDPYAQMMQGAPRERVSPGRFARGMLDTGAGMLKGATQAAIGMPGDIESLIRMGVGSEREAVLPTTDRVKAFIDRYAPLGLPADEGTGGRTAAEYFGEFMSPAAATRPLVRGAQAVGEGAMEGARRAERALDQPVQDIMRRGGTAAELLESFSTVPAHAVRPPGGNVFPELVNEVVASSDVRRAIERLPANRQDDIQEFLNTKAKRYFEKDYASTKDPLYEAFKEGRIATLSDTPAFRGYMLNAARDGNPQALEDLARNYDRGLEPTLISRPRVEGSSITSQLEGERAAFDRLMQSLQEAPGPALDVERQLPSRYSVFRSQENIEGYPLNRPLSAGEMMAVERGDPIYRHSGSYAVPDFMRPESIVEALADIPAERLKNMSYPEAVIAINQPARFRANWDSAVSRVREGKDVPKDVKNFGLSDPLLKSDNGAWHRIQDARAAEMEGAMMGHSVGGYSRVGSYGHGGLEALQSGRAQVYTLRDSKGNARVTVEALNTPEGLEITQIKGRSNAGPREAEVQDVMKLFERLDEGGRLRDIRTESYLTRENAPADALTGTTEWKRLYDEYLLGKQ